MNALFLKDLAHKTRRGLRGRVEAGRSGGGNAYGYDIVRTLRPDGAVDTGKRRINRSEAKSRAPHLPGVQPGVSPREIAKKLNREGVIGPSGSSWGPSTINGNRERGTGILNNELYIGRLVWNRQRYVKDPATGKRRSRPNPEKDWITTDVPDLRIVPQDLWEAVKARQEGMARQTRPDAKRREFWELQRPRYLLSGLMKCGAAAPATRSSAPIDLLVQERVIARPAQIISPYAVMTSSLRFWKALRNRLMEPALFEEFAREFTAEVNRQRSSIASERKALQADLDRVSKQIDKLVDAIIEGADALALNAKLKHLEKQKARH